MHGSLQSLYDHLACLAGRRNGRAPAHARQEPVPEVLRREDLRLAKRRDRLHET